MDVGHRPATWTPDGVGRAPAKSTASNMRDHVFIAAVPSGGLSPVQQERFRVSASHIWLAIVVNLGGLA